MNLSKNPKIWHNVVTFKLFEVRCSERLVDGNFSMPKIVTSPKSYY